MRITPGWKAGTGWGRESFLTETLARMEPLKRALSDSSELLSGVDQSGSLPVILVTGGTGTAGDRGDAFGQEKHGGNTAGAGVSSQYFPN